MKKELAELDLGIAFMKAIVEDDYEVTEVTEEEFYKTI